ncbi:MAG TPA: hypothetical protein VMS63_06175 [Gaiellaceae bacterium]|jgi:chromosome segregation ATPase|nr:hypothetical protein [Gaiellaceae bacterium]
MDRWEEGFDAWVPSEDGGVDTGTEDERRELLRLARELGAARNAAREPVVAVELEPLKQTLRRAIEAIAAYRNGLAELRLGLEAELAAAQAERELAAAEREHLDERERTIHDVEKELASLRVALEAQRLELEARERALDDRPSFSEGLAELSPASKRTPAT